jgi:hypothetical protein
VLPVEEQPHKLHPLSAVEHTCRGGHAGVGKGGRQAAGSRVRARPLGRLQAGVGWNQGGASRGKEGVRSGGKWRSRQGDGGC